MPVLPLPHAGKFFFQVVVSLFPVQIYAWNFSLIDCKLVEKGGVSVKTKLLIPVILVFCLSVAGVFAQTETPETGTILAALTESADRMAGSVKPYLKAGNSIHVQGLTYMNQSTQLGNLWSALLLSRLSDFSLSGVSLYDRSSGIPVPVPDTVFIVSGEAFRLEDRIFLTLSLKQGPDKRTLSVLESSLPQSREILQLLSQGTAGSSAGGDDYEPNNAAFDAYPLELDSRLENLTLEPSGDSDWFSIEIFRETLLSVGTEGALDTMIDFFGPDSLADPLYTNDDGEFDNNALLTAAVSDPGLYYIRVYGYDASERGSYSLFIRTEVWEPESGEPNNTRSQAELLDLAELPATRSLLPRGDEDWYRLDVSSLEKEEDLVFGIFTASTMDTYMELYRGDELLQSDDDGGLDGNAQVTFTPEQGGEDYFLLVRGYDSDAAGNYELGIRTINIQLDAYEPNNTREEATNLEMNQIQEHTLPVNDEIDWFVFRIQDPQNITVETLGSLDTYLILYDSQGNIIEESDDDGSDYNGSITRYMARGDYYCSINLYSSEGDSSNYRILLSSY